jgi:hypothetical protein
VSGDLEAEIDDLYVAPLDEFVRRRDALARSLRQAGEQPSADRVAGLRKPSLVAWTVNQLARTSRRDVDLLLDAGRRIVDAQQASITKGERASLDAAQSSLRAAIYGLTESAREILGDRASRSTLTHVAETLRAAATGAEGRELLARGRLTEELSETGWEIIAGLTPMPESARKTRSTVRRGTGAAASPGQEPEQESSLPELLEAKRGEISRLTKTRDLASTKLEKARRTEQDALRRLEKAQRARAEATAVTEARQEQLEKAQAELRALEETP